MQVWWRLDTENLTLKFSKYICVCYIISCSYLVALSLAEEDHIPGEAQTHPGGPAHTTPLPSQAPTQQNAQTNQELSE